MARYHMQKEEREIIDVAVIEALLSEGVYATLAFARGSEPYLATLNYGYDAANHRSDQSRQSNTKPSLDSHWAQPAAAYSHQTHRS